MMSSIKFKLFLAMSGLIVFYVLMSWLLNDNFLVDYYYSNKEETLMENYVQINEIYQGYPFELLLELEKRERTEGLYITIVDPSYKYKYNSSFKEEGFFEEENRPNQLKQPPSIPDISIIAKALEASEESPVIQKWTDMRLNSDFIYLVGLLNNGDYIFMSTPVVAIEESAMIANKFFIVTGLITIVTGLIIVFIFSGRFTRPILHLSEIAQRMAKLDFSQKYPVKTRDEIGQLGISINSLSEQLEKSITDLRKANEKLLQDIEQERKIDNMRKEFISNVSHELKTPIALIQGYAEGLKLNVNESEEDKNFYCDVVIDEISKMNKLVKQLLDLSQIDSGYACLERVDFDFSQLIDFVLRKNALLFKENSIILQKDIEDNLVVNADSDRIEQVIVNYLVNAVHHVDEKKIIEVKARKAADKVIFSIFNSGLPIPEEDLDKVWTSFYKIDKARTREYGGTGLGLAIVRAILEQHQNRYGAINKENGVEFWFELDLAVSDV